MAEPKPDVKPEQPSPLADVKLTKSAEDVIHRAYLIAATRGAREVEATDAIDILEALLQTRGTLADKAMRSLGADPATLAKSLPPRTGSPVLPLKQLIHNSLREALVLGHYQVDSIHLLLALLYSDSPATSIVLQGAGITLYDLRRHLQTSTKQDFTAGAGDRAKSEKSRPDAALRRKPLESLAGAFTISPVFLALVGVTAAAGVTLWFDALPNAVPVVTLVFVLGGWITSVCVHEFGHAIVAYLGGDRSVAAQGYLSLNPLRYHNMLYSTVMPIVFLLLGGLGLPGGAVYVNHAAIRSRAWDSAVSVAGPAGTLLCGLLIAVPFLVPGHVSWLTSTNIGFFAALAYLGFIEGTALVLNLIPVPGFDGFGIIAPWLPLSTRFLAYQYGQLAMFAVFLALWYVVPIRDAFFNSVFQLSTLVHIDSFLINLGRALMPHVGL
jgi:Zn-dependent protease